MCKTAWSQSGFIQAFGWAEMHENNPLLQDKTYHLDIVNLGEAPDKDVDIHKSCSICNNKANDSLHLDKHTKQMHAQQLLFIGKFQY